ncbi:DUF397 domain-containing protein [Streptomyces aidingensis]|uniref:DUF397 domain-containing protein n=1 Tax=Streptomyces aidingensis TaxID=910347 RepID=A0A1I1F2P6_9ACTN|nr:DUF397 domain-containing protein [Streptomyces aidingensis]SFB93655.1 protein of unknown function [Streptomyces aidingensis]
MTGIAIQWQKSSFSGANGPDCVELAHGGGPLLLRESDAPETVLAASPAAFAALLTRLKEPGLPWSPL